jgi:RNA-directed DNA polymerase
VVGPGRLTGVKDRGTYARVVQEPGRFSTVPSSFVKEGLDAKGKPEAKGKGGEVGVSHSTGEAGEPAQWDSVEGRGYQDTEPWEGKMAGISRPDSISTKQARIAELARQMPGKALHSLSRNVDLPWMREAFRRTRKDGAVGVDKQTAADYADELETNLRSLLDRAKSGQYRAPAVRRVYIPKGDGVKTRPIGIPTFEDKVLQRAVVMLLEPVYEQEFYDFSYGFRPRKSPHQALDALNDGIHQMGGGWVLDVDIKGFFDTLDHGILRDLLRKRVTDGVVARLVGKWLRAGVMEGGVVTRSEKGTPQGGVVSPMLANRYLHEIVDEWWVSVVLPRMRGRAFMIRYADDFVMVFSSKRDALRVQEVLPKRLGRFGLTLHPDKTRLVHFQRPYQSGKGPKMGSFDFLGMTFYWGKSRKGRWSLKRKTAKGRLSRALRSINQWLRRVRHLPVREQARFLGLKLRGHFLYYGIRGNSKSLNRFRYETYRLWFKWLNRRSQRRSMTWEVFNLLCKRHRLPPARINPPGRQLQLANLCS